MDYKLISFIIMLTVFVSYVAFIWIVYGIQKSISASYYVLPEKLRFIFTFFCWGFAVPAIITGVETTPLMFFAGAGICFVGAAAQINDKWIYKIHMTAAISGVVFSQLAIFFGYDMLYVNLISVIMTLLTLILSKKNYFWWIELVAFAAICYAIGNVVL